MSIIKSLMMRMVKICLITKRQYFPNHFCSSTNVGRNFWLRDSRKNHEHVKPSRTALCWWSSVLSPLANRRGAGCRGCAGEDGGYWPGPGLHRALLRVQGHLGQQLLPGLAEEEPDVAGTHGGQGRHGESETVWWTSEGKSAVFCISDTYILWWGRGIYR